MTNFNLQVSIRTQAEIEDIFDYYARKDVEVALDFLESIQDAYKTLQLNPFFQIRYKIIRQYNLVNFPYTLYFQIGENQKSINLLSCFHQKLNPIKRP